MRRRGFFWAVFLLIIYFTAPFWGWRHSGFAPITVPDTTPVPSPTAEPAASQPYHAVWVSYLEWQQVDFSSAQAFSADIAAMFDNIVDLGATVVLVQVRPFGDALYPSDYYPFSHLCTGTQGQGPGFDPLALLVQAAHARGLQLEAWINPYRLQSGSMPLLCAQSPALLHPEWTKTTSTGLYLNPASAEVRAFISDAVAELCHNYDLDGIHFDDYFYPTTDPAFDADDYAAAGTALSLDDWRRQNVNALMALCYRTAHQYGVRFGVAPIGDPDRSYADQYSDAALWLAQGGMLVVVIVAALTDAVLSIAVANLPGLGITYQSLILPVVLVWYIFTELGSIAENAAHMGADVPDGLLKLLAAGKKAAERQTKDDEE